MNTKTTIVLLILLIFCVGYILVFHAGWFGKEDKPDVATEGDKRLAGQVGEIQQLVLEKPGAEKIVFVRRDGKWHITDPIDSPATDWSVDAIVTNVVGLRYIHKYAEDDPDCPRDDLTHLSAPLQSVTFTDDKNKTCTIKIGQEAPPPPSGRIYVQLAGDKHIYVVEADLQNSLGKTLAEYRQKYISRFENEQAERITVRGDEKYQLVKTGGKWSIDSPVSAPADSEKVRSLLRAVSDIRADNFIDDNPKDLAPYGLDKPRLVVTVELLPPAPATAPATQPAPKHKVISIAFGTRTDEKVFAKLADKPWVFAVAESDLTDLQPKLSDLREKRIMKTDGKEITQIELSLSAGGSASLEKADGKWRMLSPFTGECNDQAVGDLLATLRDLKADEFRDNPTALAAFGLDPPQGKITLRFRDSDRKNILLLGTKSDSGQMGFVMPADSRSVAVIPSAELTKLLQPSPTYWNRTIFKLPENATVTRVELDRPDGKFTIVETADGKFRLTSPIKADTDAENVNALLDSVRNIRADKIVVLNETLPKRFADAKGIKVALTWRLGAPADITTTTSAPTTTQATTKPTQPQTHSTVLIVTKDDGKSFVRVEGESPIVVGQVRADCYDLFAVAEMRERTALKIDADKITAIKMVMGEDTMEFVRSEKVWRYTADRFVKIDNDSVEKFLSGLSGTKAERFVDYSPKPDLKRFSLDSPAMTLILKTDEGREISLKIARTGPVGTKGLYAVSSEVAGVFVMSPETSAKMRKVPKDFQKKDSNRQPYEPRP
ncbi:MAG: DUF4340 domain-containing protein [Planctomycetota bacterium]|nr:DUF4340 domain-containing protein [Planctomycetota bacterium]